MSKRRPLSERLKEAERKTELLKLQQQRADLKAKEKALRQKK